MSVPAPPRATRLISRWAVPLALYAAYRLAMAASLEPRHLGDSPDYLAGPSLAGSHAPFTSWFYALLAESVPAIVLAQSLVSVAAWTFLAWSVARAVRARWLRGPAAGLVLLFGASDPIVQWEGSVLSESLSLSLLALVAACALLLTERWTRPRTGLLVASSAAWALTRDQNAFVLLAVAAAIVILAALRRAPRRVLGIAAAFAAVVAVTTASGVISGRLAHPNLFYNTMARRILTEPARVEWFKAHGMPVSPALLRLAGAWATAEGSAFYTDPELVSFRGWVAKAGRRTLLLYLATHPGASFAEPVAEGYRMLSPPDPPELGGAPGLSYYRPIDFATPMPLLSAATYPWSTPLLWLMAGVAFLAALASAVRYGARAAWWVPLCLVGTSFPYLALVWWSGSLEVGRLGLMPAVQLRLGVWILFVFATDRYSRPTAQ